MPTLTIYLADNLEVLPTLSAESVALIYIDPPFSTGKVRRHTRLATTRDEAGDRVGFGGRTYRSTALGARHYADAFEDYLALLEPRLAQARRTLRPDGSLFVHLDYREVHYVKVLLDDLLGRAAYELGRDCLLIDNNPQAIEVMAQRFRGKEVIWRGCAPW